MSRDGDKIEVLPPKFDDNGNPLVVEEGSKSGTSKTPTLEYFMKTRSSRPRIRSLRKRERKAKHTPPQAKMVSPHSKRKSHIRGGREETSTISLLITLCPSITIICVTLSLTLLYPLARLPILMGQTITNRSIA
jgi:hypothetical protein